MTPPRLYCLAATAAPVVLVFRRGPTDWFHLLRWHLDRGVLEPGAWVKKTLYPQRCDISPDGELIAYMIGGKFEQPGYDVFGGISRAPWLTPLVSWDEHGTAGRGPCFATDATPHLYSARVFEIGTHRLRIGTNNPKSFLNERRRGWAETADCPPEDPADPWDEHRGVILHKSSPDGEHGLRLERTGRAKVEALAWLWSIRPGDRIPEVGAVPKQDETTVRYFLGPVEGPWQPLRDIVWADWDRAGRLLMATRSGRLQAGAARGHMVQIIEDHDLCGLTPNPQPAPEWAASIDAERTVP